MKKFFTLIAVALVALSTMAGELTVFNGTDRNQNIPFRATYFDWTPYYGEVIYPAEEITDLLGQEITSITFYIANENGNVMSGGELSLYLGTTTETQFTGWDISLIPAESLTLVSAMPMTPGDSEIVFNLDEPFTYTGDNLVLLTSVTVEGNYSDVGYFYGETAQLACSAYGASTIGTEYFYPKTTFTYEGGEDPGNTINTLAEANALDDNAEFTFGGDAVVTLCKNGYLFLRDESGYAQIKDVQGFENGQVLSEGWKATKTTINDPWVRYINAEGLTASGETNAQLAAAQKLTGAVDESMLNAYVYVENVTISSGMMPGLPMHALPLPDGTSIGVTSTLWGMSWPAGGSKNIYGVICKVGDALMINVCGFENYEEPQHGYEVGDVNHDHELDIADVTILISYVLKNGVGSACPICADVNGDTEISIADVTVLINKVLTKN